MIKVPFLFLGKLAVGALHTLCAVQDMLGLDGDADLDELIRDTRLLKRLKRGKISREEFEEQIEGDVEPSKNSQ